MDIAARPRRVTGPLCSAARARLTGTDQTSNLHYSSSSGSEHEATTCLSRLVQAFLEIDNDHDQSSDGRDHKSDDQRDDDNTGYYSAGVIRELLDPETDLVRVRLAAAVRSAAEAEKGLRWENPVAFRRAVMARLRGLGYDAGVCKARWETSGSLTGGSHEYIDVMFDKTRYIVEPEFGPGIEIARATEEYQRIVRAMPDIVVAKADAVGRAVRLVAEAARRSLRQNGMPVPPWRKSRYMLAKWLGPYKRSCTSVVIGPIMSGENVQCRAVGFAPASAVEGFRLVRAARMR